MALLNLNIPHNLSKEDALERVKSLLKNLQEEHKDTISNVKENWQGDKNDFSFSAKGFDLAGTIQVNPSDVVIQSDLPFALSFFKGMIGSMISQKASTLLS